jgi:protein-S-isoprenylcysteine O-methyltransferase Ste14
VNQRAETTTTQRTETTPKRSEASLGELVSEMTSELSSLFRQEVELAKVEARQEASRAARAGSKLAVAGVAGLLAALLVSMAAAWLLDQAINRALAFLIVGVVWAIVGAVLYTMGRRDLKDVEGLPATRETIKEDVEWAKAQKS